MMNQTVLKILQDAENDPIKGREFRFWWGRKNDATIWISTVGYKVMPHNDVEADLLKVGCRYAKGLPIQEFDRMSGRTITFLTEPPKEEAWTCPSCEEETEPATDDPDDSCLDCKISAAEGLEDR